MPVTKPTFACVRCSDRKVRCDRQNPCNACVRHNVQCILPSPKPSRRRKKHDVEALVYERLRHCEALLEQQGISLDQAVGAAKAPSNQPESIPQEAPIDFGASRQEATVFTPQIIHGKTGTKLVDNNLWSRVAEEICNTDGILDEEYMSDDSDDESHTSPAYILGCIPPIVKLPHPPADTAQLLWRTFVMNVDPLTKMVHVPTLQVAIEKAIVHVERVPSGFEALMFAMYSMAIVSLSDGDCKERLGESRETLLLHFVASTKSALARANFMSSTSIVVLQALVLHILSIRDTYEARAVWSLTGLAIRIAEAMGMGLDGTLLGLSPFESEIRRRIWWQLKMHDFRAAELAGQAKFRDFDLDETTPKRPANVNDSDLYPAMKQPPVESTKPTEMLWNMMRSELSSFAASQKAMMRKLGKVGFRSEDYSAMDNLDMKDNIIKEIEDLLETKYLRFCDPSQPLQFQTLLGGRLSTSIVRFIAHHPRRWAQLNEVPESERRLVWDIVIQALEQYNMMQSSPQLRHFSWNIPYFIQWHVVIHILDTLRAEPLHQDAPKVWELVGTLYENNLDMLLGNNKPISTAVGNLCLKAFDARKYALAEQGITLSELSYIWKLREQREAAKERRDAATVKSRKREKHPTELGQVEPEPMGMSREAYEEVQPMESAEPRSQINISDDAFWLNQPAGHLNHEGPKFMDFGPDTLVADDYWLDTAHTEPIDWTQWDAWLGEIDVFHPSGATFR